MNTQAAPESPARRPLTSRPRPGARRAGYIVAAVVNAVMLYLVNRWPGWEAVPFLTDATVLVLGIVNASFVVGIVANIVYLVADPPRLRALGDLVTTGVGIAAMVRVWQVFPFDLGGTPWEVVVRVLLVVAMFGSGVAIMVALVRLVRGQPNAV